MKAYEVVEFYFHVFLTWEIDGGEWLASRLDRFTPKKQPQYKFCRKICEP
jgi:hypothetical protein